MNLSIRHIDKRFGAFHALKDVSLEVKSGELLALLGPSGSGKTTLLRILSGLEAPDRGSIYFGDRDVTEVDAPERRVGFVFQHYALIKHMSVFENVAFGLRVLPRAKRPEKAVIDKKVKELLRLVKLEELATRSPTQLSGGQRQRVAFARALAIEPKVLLLDEPFGALDARVRDDLRRWLRKLHDEISVTSIFVTHDQEEALAVADRVAVLNHGKVEQIGRAADIYETPESAFVCTFLGQSNAFRAQVEAGRVKVGGSTFDVTADLAHGTEVIAYARPHEIDLRHGAPADGALGAKVRHVRAFGGILRVELETLDGGDALTAEIREERDVAFRTGDHVHVQPRAVRVFRAAS
jgi:sulfate transport system ATP-binding protein